MICWRCPSALNHRPLYFSNSLLSISWIWYFLNFLKHICNFVGSYSYIVTFNKSSSLIQFFCVFFSAQLIARLHSIGICLSPSSKALLLNDANESSRSLIVEKLRGNPIPKIVGDNLDVYVKSTNPAQTQDLHLFNTIMVFPRVSNVAMNNA